MRAQQKRRWGCVQGGCLSGQHDSLSGKGNSSETLPEIFLRQKAKSHMAFPSSGAICPPMLCVGDRGTKHGSLHTPMSAVQEAFKDSPYVLLPKIF